MLKLGEKIRLTAVEASRLSRVTGKDATGIRTLEELDVFIDAAYARMPDDPSASAILTEVLDDALLDIMMA